jgi:hypothetical protein
MRQAGLLHTLKNALLPGLKGAETIPAKETGMVSAALFTSKMAGIEQKYLFEYEDERGKCHIGYAGGIMPERPGWAFYYSDGTYEFCFYANRVWEGNDTYDVEVKDATAQHMYGGTPHIDPADISRIRRNMEKFFLTRNFLTPIRPICPGEQFRNLILSWRLP